MRENTKTFKIITNYYINFTFFLVLSENSKNIISKLKNIICFKQTVLTKL